MTQFVRTPESNFEALAGFAYSPNYHVWQDLRVHYVDEGPRDGPVMLLLHGMPTWSYLYRDVIPQLVDAGYRCIAPDHLGFGRSDKPTDLHWYTIARHTEVLTSLITALDLRDITLVCQDWGGPTGLAQAATMPNRFVRICIMNTWLHHPQYEYSEAIVKWNGNWKEGGLFCREKPEMGILLLLATGLLPPDVAIPAIVKGEAPGLEGRALEIYTAYSAPYRGMGDEAFNGYRRFPLSIPLAPESYAQGNGAAQTHHYTTLLGWDKPIHFIWGCADNIFTEEWGRTWADQMGASFDAIPDAAHFLQDSHGEKVAELLLGRIADE